MSNPPQPLTPFQKVAFSGLCASLGGLAIASVATNLLAILAMAGVLTGPAAGWALLGTGVVVGLAIAFVGICNAQSMKWRSLALIISGLVVAGALGTMGALGGLGILTSFKTGMATLITYYGAIPVCIAIIGCFYFTKIIKGIKNPSSISPIVTHDPPQPGTRRPFFAVQWVRD